MAYIPVLRLLFAMLIPVALSAAIDRNVESSTALSPNVPSGNSSDVCMFGDLKSLLAQIESDGNGRNVSLLVRTCPGICPLVYGSGNPDISGIGV